MLRKSGADRLQRVVWMVVLRSGRREHRDEGSAVLGSLAVQASKYDLVCPLRENNIKFRGIHLALL